MLYNYSNFNTIFNMIMCVSMLSISHLYPSDLHAMTIATYPLFVYCIVDTPFNTFDMILHHTFTLMLGHVLNVRYSGQNEELTLIISKAFVDTEISTIFLNLMYLRYRHFLVKFSFIATFFYYRIVCIIFLLFINPTTSYFSDQSEFICDNDTGCHAMWSVSTLGLLSLNIYWFVKILEKVLKKS